MDKTIISIIGAVSALATLDVACASAAVSPSPPPSIEARSFGDLLAPIPNAAAMLRSIDAARAPTGAQSGVQLAQYDQYHHHHHHYRPPPRHYYHHHHHHHHYYHPPQYHHQEYQQPSYDQPSYDHEGY